MFLIFGVLHHFLKILIRKKSICGGGVVHGPKLAKIKQFLYGSLFYKKNYLQIFFLNQRKSIGVIRSH